jgi:hypothetical protein
LTILHIQRRFFDFWILVLNTVPVHTRKTQPTPDNPEKDWQKSPFGNLIRYVSSGTYYARLRVKGKLVRRSLKTSVLSVAKLRLGDFEREERQRGAETNTASCRKREHHSLASVRSVAEPPRSWNFPLSCLTKRAVPKLAMSSPSFCLIRANRFSFMRGVWRRG